MDTRKTVLDTLLEDDIPHTLARAWRPLARAWRTLASVWRNVLRLLVAVVVLAMAVAIILNLRYKPLGMVDTDDGPPYIAYIDTWTGKPHFCLPGIPAAGYEGLVCVTMGRTYMGPKRVGAE